MDNEINNKKIGGKIGIIDADLLGVGNHRFPNLVCEKLSAYYKEKGCEVNLLLNYDNLNDYDEVYISKVFTDTPFPNNIKETDKIHLGGTGFYFDKAPNLPYEIEHHMPDYHLYDEWINNEVKKAEKRYSEEGRKFNKTSFMVQFKEYTDYSIGFMTRGCFRKCPFCVNQKYNKVELHSPLEEFYDPTRKKICLLDDNVLGNPHWKEIFEELQATGKPFKFKQGLDERLLTDEKCEVIFNSRYDGYFTFAFDNIEDYDLIEKKLKLIRKHTNTLKITFYVLVGFKSTDMQDIEDMFSRVLLLMKYRCLPYIMRYKGQHECPWETSEFRGMYIQMARWCNQPSLFRKKSFREFCELNQKTIKTKGKLSAPMKVLKEFEEKYHNISQYFDIKWDDFNNIDEELEGE